jgi:hypothetical protein
MSGKDLRDFAQRYAQSVLDGKSSIQISGLTCTWKSAGGKAEVQSLKVGGADPADGQSYVCATSDFVVNQADKYLGIVPTAVNYTSTTVYGAMVAKVQKEKTMNSRVENRFQEIH